MSAVSRGGGSKRSGNGRSGFGGSRQMGQRVKTARSRTVSSARWLERQLNDPYVAAAKREGWRSRAAFKLLEMDDKHRFLKAGARVVDLGAAPGGWSQVAALRVNSRTASDLAEAAANPTDEANESGASPEGGDQQVLRRRGQVVAIDYLPFEALAGVEMVQLDFMDNSAPGRLMDLLRGGRADVVLSDMAAPTTGHKSTDHLRIMGLAEAALAFATDVLTPGGTFLAKMFQGGSERALLAELKRAFTTVRHIKPPASRSDSAELYVLALGYRGGGGA